jgi:hypothetical protein
MRLFFAVIFFTALPVCLAAQTGNTESGAQAYGMGNASVSLGGEWALFHNPAGISQCTSPVLSFSYLHGWGLEGFGRAAAVAVAPFRIGCFGAGVHRFGDELYREQTLSLAFANRIGFVRLGVRLNYLEVYAEGFGRKGTLTADFGGTVELIPSVIFGAQISNFTRTSLLETGEAALPVVLKAGFSFRPAESLMINTDLVVEDMETAFMRLGLQYLVAEAFSFRAGYETLGSGYFAGIGFRRNHFGFDTAMGYNTYLGFSQQASVSFIFGKP